MTESMSETEIPSQDSILEHHGVSIAWVEGKDNNNNIIFVSFKKLAALPPAKPLSMRIQ